MLSSLSRATALNVLGLVGFLKADRRWEMIGVAWKWHIDKILKSCLIHPFFFGLFLCGSEPVFKYPQSRDGSESQKFSGFPTVLQLSNVNLSQGQQYPGPRVNAARQMRCGRMSQDAILCSPKTGLVAMKLWLQQYADGAGKMAHVSATLFS